MSILIIDITERDGEAEHKYIHNEYFTDRKLGPRSITATEDAVEVIRALAAKTLQHVDGYYLEEEFANQQFVIRSKTETWITYTIRQLDNYVAARAVDSIVG